MNPQEKSQSSYKIFEPLLLAISMVIGMLLGYNIFDNKNDLSLLNSASIDTTNSSIGMGRIEEIIRLVENSYVDDIDVDDVSNDAIHSILKQLDPHSSYISPEELDEYNQRMEGVHKGIGIESQFIDDSLFVSYVIPDSEADKAGVIPGNIILEIAKDTVSGKNRSIKYVKELIRKAGTPSLSFKIQAQNKRIADLDIGLEDVVVESASSHYLIGDNYGYLKISRFSANTYDQFFKSLESLAEQSSKDDFNLILDLRDNPGGYVPQTLRILSQLFNSKGKLLSYTIGEHRKRKEYKSTGRNFYKINNIVVLINGNSASASEIIAGAMQDWDRGILIGEGSYGKGLVQEIFPLKRGGAIRLTVARYATPSGRFIQKPYVIKNDDQIQEDSTFYTKKFKRKILNNGGIIPDIEIKEDEDFKYDNKITEFVCKNILPFKNKVDLKELMDETKPLSLYNGTSEFSDRQIRAELIHSWYGKISYYEYFQQRDPYVMKAIEVLSKEDPMRKLASNEL